MALIAEPLMSRDDYARRLIRARNWHLHQLGRLRFVRYELVDEEIRHEEAAARLAVEIDALATDVPPPPPRPRIVT